MKMLNESYILLNHGKNGSRGWQISRPVDSISSLNRVDKLILEEIKNLSNSHGCKQDNFYFAARFYTSEQTAKRSISKLKKLGYVKNRSTKKKRELIIIEDKLPKRIKEHAGFFIHKTILLIDNINLTDKFFLSIVFEFNKRDGDKGCFAKNDYWTQRLDIERNRLYKIAKKLERLGYLYIKNEVFPIANGYAKRHTFYLTKTHVQNMIKNHVKLLSSTDELKKYREYKTCLKNKYYREGVKKDT